jgi:hypothetical protein
MNAWHMAIAAALCLLLVACSRHESVFSLSPVFTARSTVPASAVAGCVAHRWKQGTRGLHRGERGGAITLRAESLFRGAPIGLRVVPDGQYARVEYFRRRHVAPLYGSMVRGCLDPDANDGADDAPDVPKS